MREEQAQAVEVTEVHDTRAVAEADQGLDLVHAVNAACKLRTSAQLQRLLDRVQNLLVNRMVAERETERAALW